MPYFSSKSNGVNDYPMDSVTGSREPLYNKIDFGTGWETSCLRCLRSSPCPSLFGLLLNYCGLGCACGGVIFGIEFTVKALGMNPFFPELGLMSYIVTGVTAFFVLLAYLLCVLCTGSNMHYVFSRESRVTAGRVLNGVVIFGCLIGVLAWTASACCLWTPVFAIATLKAREGRLNLTDTATHDLSYFGIYDTDGNASQISQEKFTYYYESMMVAFSMGFAGCVLSLIGFVHIAICCAANFSKLKELNNYGIGITRENGHQANTQL